MKQFAAILVLIIAVTGLMGCRTTAQQPAMSNAMISPAVLNVGDSGVITVQVTDRNQVVNKVEGKIRGNDDIVFKLKDDGVLPDEKAGDGIWTIQVDTHFQAPPGEYVMDISAHDSSNQVVVVHDRDAGAMPLTVTCTVSIKYPDQE